MPEERELDELTAAAAGAIAVGVLIEGAPTREWRTRLTKKQLDRIMDSLRESLVSGNDLGQAITAAFGGTVDGVPITGVTNAMRRDLDSLISTAIAGAVNAARLETFQINNDFVKGIQQVSVLDNRTSDICLAYSGQSWDIETLEPIFGSTLPFNGGPPRHFNCRSTIVPIIYSADELAALGIVIPKAQRKNFTGKPPGDITLDQWLRGKSKTYQDRLLGPARARLWRSGSITLTQLVDMRGNPMNLEQLRKKVLGRRKR